jgi:hypothetical protein
MMNIATLATIIYVIAVPLVRERGERRMQTGSIRGRVDALESCAESGSLRLKAVERSVHVLEAREGAGGPLSSRRPLPSEPSQSGVRPRATIGAPPEDETRVMMRAR